MKKTVKKAKNTGVALLLVLISLALMVIVTFEIAFQSRVEISIGANALNRLQAYYLAQSSARFSLLRLYMYKEVTNMGTLPPNVPQSMVDKIWSMPLPPFPFLGAKTDWPGTISSSITSENSKIPINLLDGNLWRKSSPAMVQTITSLITQLITGLMADENFEKKYRDLKVEDLLIPLQIWVSPELATIAGAPSDKAGDYEKLDPPYTPRYDRMPTLTELHMVSNWSDDLIKRIGKNFSVINMNYSINPNFISLDQLLAMDPQLSPEDLKAIDKHRLEFPFANLTELVNFIRTDSSVKNGRNFQLPEIPGMDPNAASRETVFTILASAQIQNSMRTIRLGVRFDPVATPTTVQQQSQQQRTQPPPAQPGASTTGTATPPAKLADPTVVSIEEVL